MFIQARANAHTRMRGKLDDYPALPHVPAPSGTVSGSTLAEAAAHVAVAAATDETLPILTGVQFVLATDTMTLSATDRYRFHIAAVPWTPTDRAKGRGKSKSRTEGLALVPADILRDTARILADTEEAQISVTDGQFAVCRAGGPPAVSSILSPSIMRTPPTLMARGAPGGGTRANQESPCTGLHRAGWMLFGRQSRVVR
ncbi:hypothetical protein [Streptomyces sp. NPDC005244]|uniref:DNA polymerase III subunit beta family protein n=1 Tax=Streptomyces sp. NPDC005244 TaxID=3364708 RepID=UPI00368176D3